MTWAPLLTGGNADLALQIVASIAEELRKRFDASSVVSPTEAWSLATGRSGVALFFAYCGAAFGDEEALALGARLVEESLEAAMGPAPLAGLFEGFAGVAWTLAHLDGWLLDVSDNDPNDAVDVALLEVVTTRPWSGEYDLLAGLAGLGVYALERLPRRHAMELLAAVVSRLEAQATRDALHTFWWTTPERLPGHIRDVYPGGAWNLGAAHGAPGVIALLARAQAAGVVVAQPMLARAVDWLLAQQLPVEADSAFPSFLAPDVAPRGSPMAWCYGDPGAAGALLVAGRNADAPAWQAEAKAIAERAASRTGSESGGGDASFCHGCAGLAHIFNRLHQATGSEVLRLAAEAWLARLLDASRSGGVFMPEDGHGRIEVDAESGFLTGAAGIGLVLLAAATPVEPRWDRVYLLS